VGPGAILQLVGDAPQLKRECDLHGAGYEREGRDERQQRHGSSAVAALSDGACARAPGLISVHGPGWLRVGDMMVDGVIPQRAVIPPKEALRPLGLQGRPRPAGGGGRSMPGAGRGASV
jgi:hypothetical protein